MCPLAQKEKSFAADAYPLPLALCSLYAGLEKRLDTLHHGAHIIRQLRIRLFKRLP